jgi:hypothetical protein
MKPLLPLNMLGSEEHLSVMGEEYRRVWNSLEYVKKRKELHALGESIISALRDILPEGNE